ncbi:hypothetical protein PR202_gb04233 [Eleusine coracana subsp. coracana]|uniref:Poly(A) RNA polymerase mitochondrial-like central palm domain-containing protein n=1 Tax=Eleusine coracana subsp. coracana TaxID=191504 RepID=A0AAV5E410_ELECO|nr:hypothetical protein PR202_gb04233 [Eleusine coracana subsp. coracana]
MTPSSSSSYLSSPRALSLLPSRLDEASSAQGEANAAAVATFLNCYFSTNPVTLLGACAAVKPFGSFLSDLYSKSGDLDLSIQLWTGSNLPVNKKRKQNVLREVRKVLLNRGVAGYMQFIPHARVPVLQSKSGQKLKIFNDPKTGSLNSYSLCLLVLFHFQTSEPPILPPLKDIYEGNITEDTTEMASYNEDQINEVEDPVERPDNAARAVSMKGLERIVSAFKDAYQKLDSLEHVDRNELLECSTKESSASQISRTWGA